ncbi:MAG: hypothetical protein WB439_14850 [Acidobacteriaceae bacterium]
MTSSITRTSFTAASLLLSLGLSSPLSAQQTKAPTLGEILQRVDENLNRYDSRVPSLFCDEHVVSSHAEPGEREQNTITDSIFRLKRVSIPDHPTTLLESREIRLVNGKPPTSQHLQGPALLSGAFEGALAVVSLNQTACMKYTLQRINRKHPTQPYIVRFATVLTPQNSSDCLLQEKSQGRVLIDPASMQITRLELSTPHHTIDNESSYESPVIGKRDITVDYAPVLLGGETFWMPSTITMHVTTGSGTFHPSFWSFRAAYRNYHKTEVTSRIQYDGP